MILVQKLNGSDIYLNPHLIESLEKTPDTKVNFYSGKVFLVKNTPEEIIEKIIEYRKKLGLNSQET